MISPQPPTMFTHSTSILGKPRAKVVNAARSPKSFYTLREEDQTPQLDLKRCHVRSVTQPSRRPPLNPLSPTELQKRYNRVSHSADSASSHPSFVAPSTVPDLRVSLLEQPVSSGYYGIQPRGTSSAPICSWPPPVPAVGSATPLVPVHSRFAGHQAYPTSPHVAPPTYESNRSRAAVPKSTSTQNVPKFQTEPTTTMSKQTLASGWKSENLLRPIRSRTHSMPSVRRPPEELWRSDSDPANAIHASHDAVDSLSFSTPPGLPPRRHSLKRSGSDSDLRYPDSSALSLALGSQPLRVSEHTKVVPPIGAERGRTVPIRSTVTQSNDRSQSPLCSALFSPRLQAKWKNDVYLLDTTSLEKAQAVVVDSSAPKEDLDRLLRHEVRNRYAPKIISPLSPLRTATLAFDLLTDPEYQLRMPSPSNNPSPRYTNRPSRRARTVCDAYQTPDWDTTSTHCQECKRDTLHKRFLAFRHRQHQTPHVQRAKPFAFPSRAANTFASCIQETFAYVIDDEEKSLWEEIAAVTGAGPLPFVRAGALCTAAHRPATDDRADEAHDDYLEIADDGLRAKESTTLLRDVTVY